MESDQDLIEIDKLYQFNFSTYLKEIINISKGVSTFLNKENPILFNLLVFITILLLEKKRTELNKTTNFLWDAINESGKTRIFEILANYKINVTKLDIFETSKFASLGEQVRDLGTEFYFNLRICK